jgi:hypothetical protein
MTDEKARPTPDDGRPPILGKSGPGGESWAPGETQVSGPEEYRDPWNPDRQRWHRLRNVVRRWIGGGG